MCPTKKSSRDFKCNVLYDALINSASYMWCLPLAGLTPCINYDFVFVLVIVSLLAVVLVAAFAEILEVVLRLLSVVELVLVLV